jgi:hypothetical protein
MRFRVEAWDPEYGSSREAMPEPTDAPVIVDVERAARDWAPIEATTRAPEPVVLFVDGVRRTEAFGWIDETEPCTFASYAAGIVRCDHREAVVTDYSIGRAVASSAATVQPISTTCGEFRPISTRDGTPEQLNTAIQQAMTALEVRVSFAARGDDPDALLVVDGPLRERRHVPHAVGLVKRHHVRYLGDLDAVVMALRPGQRTPVFGLPSQWGKYSWYLRLPSPGSGSWEGIVRIEAPPDLTPSAVVDLAERCSATIPRYSSEAHKDGRAPQNLYPIGGLERILRHRLGDPAFVLRSLRAAAAPA